MSPSQSRGQASHLVLQVPNLSPFPNSHHCVEPIGLALWKESKSTQDASSRSPSTPPSTQGHFWHTLTPFWGPSCCSALPEGLQRCLYNLREKQYISEDIMCPSEGTAPKTQGGGWSLVGREVAHPHHTPGRHLHLKVPEDSKGAGAAGIKVGLGLRRDFPNVTSGCDTGQKIPGSSLGYACVCFPSGLP